MTDITTIVIDCDEGVANIEGIEGSKSLNIARISGVVIAQYLEASDEEIVAVLEGISEALDV